MKYRALIISCLFAVIGPVSASSDAEVILTFMQFSSEKVQIYTAPQKTVAAQPEWVPGQGNAPLGVSKALQVARTSFPNDELTSIRLVKKVFNNREVWFYVFEFSRPDQAVVLMNGELVEPETVNEKEFFHRHRGG